MFDVYPLYDINIVRAEGSYVWDDKGTKYLDMYGGHAVISIGHTHPHYVEMVTNQLKNIGFYSNSVIIAQQKELAEKLGRLSGKSDYQLFLCNSGAEANENALKLASFFNGKKKVIAMKGSFHGRTSLAVAATDNPNIVAPVNQTDNVIFVPLNDEQALEEAFLANKGEISSVILEGIQVISGITLVFLPAVSSFFIPKLLGGGQYVLIGNVIETQFLTAGDWGFGSAISLIMAIIIMISLYITRRLDTDPAQAKGGRA